MGLLDADSLVLKEMEREISAISGKVAFVSREYNQRKFASVMKVTERDSAVIDMFKGKV